MAESPSAVLRATAAEIRADVATMHSEMGSNTYWRSGEPDPDRVYTLGVENGLGGAAGVLAGRFTPGVALAVADLLSTAADVYDFCQARRYPEPRGDLYLAALELCRVYNNRAGVRGE